MPLTHRFLLAKHWHIFVLTFVLPFLLQIGVMISWFASIISQIATQTEPDFNALFSFFRFFPVLMIVYTAPHFFWLWSLAIGLQPKVPVQVPMKTRKFKTFFLFQISYLILFSVGISVFISSMSTMIESTEVPNLSVIGVVFVIVFPLHLFMMFCTIYCMYFAAKTIKTAELQREVSFGEFIGEFILIWFYVIGVWFIQPQVNKLIEPKPKETN